MVLELEMQPRWVMDDFEFGEFEEDLSPPLINLVRGYSENIVEAYL